MIKKTIFTAALAGVLAALPASAQTQTLPAKATDAPARSIVIVMRDGSFRQINLTAGYNTLMKASADGALNLHLSQADDRVGNGWVTDQYNLTIPVGLVNTIYYSSEAAPVDFTGREGFGNIILDSHSYEVRVGEDLEIGYTLPGNHPGDALMQVYPSQIDWELFSYWGNMTDEGSPRRGTVTLGTQKAGQTTIRLRYAAYNSWVNVKITDSTPGDVNSDGKVDVNDIVVTSSYILGQITEAELNTVAADVNSDGQINVNDIVGISNIILTGSASQQASVTALAAAAEPAIARYAIDDEGRLWIDCPADIAGVQFDAAGCSDIAAVDDLALSASTAELSDNAARFLAYTIGGRGIAAGLNHVATLAPGATLDGELILSDRSGRRIPAIETTLSGITDIDAAATVVGAPAENPFGATLTLPVTIADGTHRVEVTVLTPNGTVAARSASTLAPGTHTMTLDTGHLSPGLYIVAVTIDGRRAATHKALRR